MSSMGVDGTRPLPNGTTRLPGVATTVDPVAAIEVRDLTIAYGDVRAVNGLSFAAEAGEVLAVLGPNGAGKTSTIECLEGYRRPTSGEVSVLGLDPIAEHAQLVPQIGVMLQAGGVYAGIRPIEVLELFASFYDQPADPDELLSSGWASATCGAPPGASSRAASSSACRWRSPSSGAHAPPSSTSPPTGSTSRAGS